MTVYNLCISIKLKTKTRYLTQTKHHWNTIELQWQDVNNNAQMSADYKKFRNFCEIFGK